MELETLFTDQKWNILRALSSQALSPLQLSEKLNTTMANVSQQLRLLEAVDLVKKSKIRNRDKGKPRTLFSLTQNHALLIPTMHGFAGKKLLKASDHHKSILRIWFIENKAQAAELEQFYWKLRANWDDVSALLHDETSGVTYVVTNTLSQTDLRKKTSLTVRTVSPQRVGALIPTLSGHETACVYDPQELFSVTA